MRCFARRAWRATFKRGTFVHRSTNGWREFRGLPIRWKPLAKSTY